jgi:hypothetical protein
MSLKSRDEPHVGIVCDQLPAALDEDDGGGTGEREATMLAPSSVKRLFLPAPVWSDSYARVLYFVTVLRRGRDCHVAAAIAMEEKWAGRR